MDDAGKPMLIALIPAFNEELTISSVIMMALPYVNRIVVVNDGSKDRTSLLAKMAGADVIEMEANSGKAAALKKGFEYCLSFNPDCVVMLDGDGQMDPALIPRVSSLVLEGKADLVIGSRYLNKDVRIPAYRKVGLKILNSATNAGSNINITDSQSGFRALSRKALQEMNFHSESYNIESDMIVHFNEIGLRLVEVPINVRYDVPNGHKQNPWRHGFSVLSKVIGVIGYKRPLVLFGVPGIILFVVGFILSLSTFFEAILIFDWTLVTQGIAGLLSLGIGIFLFFISLVLNSLGIIMKQRKA